MYRARASSCRLAVQSVCQRCCENEGKGTGDAPLDEPGEEACALGLSSCELLPRSRHILARVWDSENVSSSVLWHRSRRQRPESQSPLRTSTLSPSGASYPLSLYVSSLTRMLPSSSCVASFSRAQSREVVRRWDASESRRLVSDGYGVEGSGEEGGEERVER